ncbi:hypothetical protein [Paludibacterium denitrificans]|uniref:Uncharacterized protein n=1 Tax=Paludibacterium denitrificans TaxID=2675226 RepID=A0A844GDG2_9NEIS|nr:hypothetical protein [Paludibacterium denitrificans]MTD33268.1 hypothetical protein [Paludibacterium denitrificans]
MRIGVMLALVLSLVIPPARAKQVGFVRFVSVPIKNKLVLQLIDRKYDIHIFFKKKDIFISRYRNYTVESDVSDVADQHNKIAAIQFSTYDIASDSARSDFHEVVKCAFVDMPHGRVLFESDSQMCDGEWKTPMLWQDASGRYLDFYKLPR